MPELTVDEVCALSDHLSWASPFYIVGNGVSLPALECAAAEVSEVFLTGRDHADVALYGTTGMMLRLAGAEYDGWRQALAGLPAGSIERILAACPNIFEVSRLHRFGVRLVELQLPRQNRLVMVGRREGGPTHVRCYDDSSVADGLHVDNQSG